MPHRHTRSTLAIASMLTMAAPITALAADPSGVWLRGDGNARVRIAPCGGNICATNLWIKDTSKGEAAGDVLILRVKADAAGRYAGSAYDPKRKLNYSMKMSVASKELKTTGCIVGGLLCKTVSWTRVQ